MEHPIQLQQKLFGPLFNQNKSLSELIYEVLKYGLHEVSQKGTKFQEIYFDGGDKKFSKSQHSNLKRKIMKKMVSDCGIVLNALAQGRMSERTFFHTLQEQKKLIRLEQKFKNERGYIEMIIGSLKNLSLMEKVFGICFMLILKKKLKRFNAEPQELAKHLDQKKKKRLSQKGEKTQEQFSQENEPKNSEENLIKREEESEEKMEFRVIIDLKEKKVEVEGKSSDLVRFFSQETEYLRAYELLRSQAVEKTNADLIN